MHSSNVEVVFLTEREIACLQYLLGNERVEDNRRVEPEGTGLSIHRQILNSLTEKLDGAAARFVEPVPILPEEEEVPCG